MSIKNLKRMGNPILRLKAQRLSGEEILSTETSELIQDLIENMHHYGGVGIAAPQIGVSKAVAILEVKNTNPRYEITEDYPLTVFINPKISILDSTLQGYWEGCLSVPGLRGYVERPRKIQIDFTDQHNRPQTVIAEGFLATVYQHELDHLEGKIYIDHITDKTMLTYNEEYEQFWMEKREEE